MAKSDDIGRVSRAVVFGEGASKLREVTEGVKDELGCEGHRYSVAGTSPFSFFPYILLEWHMCSCTLNDGSLILYGGIGKDIKQFYLKNPDIHHSSKREIKYTCLRSRCYVFVTKL